MTIGDRFREVREKTGLDQDQFAEKVGKSRTTINRIENDKTAPDLECILRIIEKWGHFDLNWLILGVKPVQSKFQEVLTKLLEVPQFRNLIMKMSEDENFELDMYQYAAKKKQKEVKHALG